MTEQTQIEPGAPVFEIQKIYLKDASWEALGVPVAFIKPWKPDIQVDIQSSVSKQKEASFEVSLNISVTCRNDKKVAFIVELIQSGLFHLENFHSQEQEQILQAVCPNILFPYARESVDSFVIKGGFNPIALKPIRFDMLYAQAKAKKQEEKQQQEHKNNRVTH